MVPEPSDEVETQQESPAGVEDGQQGKLRSGQQVGQQQQFPDHEARTVVNAPRSGQQSNAADR